MALEFLMFWLRETLSNIRRNKVMSLLAISTVTIGLFILGAFYLSWWNLSTAVKAETGKLDLAVILKRDIGDKRRREIYEAARIPQVAKVDVVLQHQVLAEFQREMPQIPMSDFADSKYNPFGDELRIKLKDPHTFFEVRNYFNTFKGKGVVATRSAEENEAVRALLGINRFLTVAGIAALGILGLAILLIIHNAIRLTIYARRKEIRIMELVGATPWFIRVPFLLEGLLYGLMGAVVAALILSPLYTAATRALSPWAQQLLPRDSGAQLIPCIGMMLIAGLLFGAIGSWFSLARSLDKPSAA
jgi:cell division transport system permease protein